MILDECEICNNVSNILNKEYACFFLWYILVDGVIQRLFEGSSQINLQKMYENGLLK